MGGELGVDSSPSQSEISSYSAEFKKWFPYFLSLGMTYDEYWNQDCTLVKAYQDAEKDKTRAYKYGSVAARHVYI